MGYQTIEVRKLTPIIGAEIYGVDLSKPLGNQQFQEVHDALMDNLVIFFRDQKLTIDQHKDFGRRFGKLHIHPARPSAIEEHPEILVIKADENVQARRRRGMALGRVVRRRAADGLDPVPAPRCRRTAAATRMFANMYRAYETLSRADQEDAGRHDRDPRRRARLPRPLRSERRGQGVPQRRASDGAHPSGDRPPGALRQSRLHDAHRAA